MLSLVSDLHDGLKPSPVPRSCLHPAHLPQVLPVSTLSLLTPLLHLLSWKFQPTRAPSSRLSQACVCSLQSTARFRTVYTLTCILCLCDCFGKVWKLHEGRRLFDFAHHCVPTPWGSCLSPRSRQMCSALRWNLITPCRPALGLA